VRPGNVDTGTGQVPASHTKELRGDGKFFPERIDGVTELKVTK
jgi:hypothetical protein